MALGNDQTGGGGSPGKEFGELEEGGDGWMVGEGWLDWLGNWQLSACPPPPVPWSRGEFNGKLKVGKILYLPPRPNITIQLRTTKIQPVTLRAAHVCYINQSPNK